jgi:hypothetical protein
MKIIISTPRDMAALSDYEKTLVTNARAMSTKAKADLLTISSSLAFSSAAYVQPKLRLIDNGKKRK